MRTVISLLLCGFLFTGFTADKKRKCYLTGKVVNRNSTTLILKKLTDDPKAADTEIPIDSSGHFQYELYSDFLEAYELIFKDELERGTWRSVLFFPENDTLSFTLYPKQMADSNKITGSELSLKRNLFIQQVTDKYHGRYMYWYQKKDSLQKTENTNAEDLNVVSQEINSLNKELSLFQLHYAVNEMNEYGYAEFIEIVRADQERRQFPLDTLVKYHNLFQKNHPGHPYNQISGYRIEGLKSIKVGGHYVDVTAPDLAGNSITLSYYISKNTLTLIDLWAPWCGPCISKSKKVVPVFEEFRGSGFGVIGVVGSINNNEQFIKAADKYNYPWTLLSEIREKNNIWEKYGIANTGGSQFLIDNKGTILAINPTPEELREFIKNAE